MSNNNNIELEFRACISEDKFLELKKYLSNEAKLLGDDSKDTSFLSGAIK